MWWRFTPSATATYRVDTIGSDFNTLIDVYRGMTITSLTPIDCNDDIDSNNPDLLVSRVAFRATAGQRYYIRVSAAGSFGQGVTIHLRKVKAPANDSFSTATTINSLPFDTNASNLNATREPTEPRASTGYFDSDDCAHQSATRWYKYTPSVDQIVWANTLVAYDFDTVLGVYTGSSIGAATRITCNNDQWASGVITHSSGITFKASAGVTYRFQVGGFDAESGEPAELPFHVRTISTESNDAFATAATFSLLPYRDAFNLRRATRQAGEPTCRPGMVNSLWYKYTPSNSGPIAVSFLESEQLLPIFVSAYKVVGAGFGGLNFLGCGNGVGFTGQVGTSYMIQVETANAFAPTGTLAVDPD